MSDDSDDVKDRVAQRFNTETDEDESSSTAPVREERSAEATTQQTQTDQNAENERNEKNERTAWNAQNMRKAQNVKKAWNAITVYLPDDIEREYSKAYKRLDLELTDEPDLTLKKTRHYNPLIIELGVERLEQMELHEIKERMEQFDPHPPE
jgi:hypothetical protein